MAPNGDIPGLRRILIVDSLAASIGGVMGASSVTSYVESAAGVAEGARTGLHSVFVGLLFLLAIFAAPLAQVYQVPVWQLLFGQAQRLPPAHPAAVWRAAFRQLAALHPLASHTTE